MKKLNLTFVSQSNTAIVLLLLALSASTFFFLLSCSSTPNDIRNILLISIDTCRADYLSCYGYHKNTTPNIDKLAQESILFSNTYTTVPLTLPAHSSMLTGTIPPYHGVHENAGYHLAKSNLTLAEVLSKNNFTTGAVISACVLDSKFGLGQGFTYYNDLLKKSSEIVDSSERTGEETNRFVFEWLDKHKNDKLFFSFIILTLINPMNHLNRFFPASLKIFMPEKLLMRIIASARLSIN